MNPIAVPAMTTARSGSGEHFSFPLQWRAAHGAVHARWDARTAAARRRCAMTQDDLVTPVVFSTRSADAAEWVEEWHEWCHPVFDISAGNADCEQFHAENKFWNIGGILLSTTVAPPARATRGKRNLSRAPVDHWVISCNRRGETVIATDRAVLRAAAGVPFLWSLGERTVSERTFVDRVQLLIPRDMFRDIAPMLDASRGQVLDTPLGRLLGDYLIFLESHLASVTVRELPRLTEAIHGMIAACLGPSAERAALAAGEPENGRLERIRRAIHARLRSPTLTPATVCKDVGISRSQLYRLFEHSGGVSRYIQRLRLLQSLAILSNPDSALSVLSVAESLCFEDASSFSRAFKREFGHSPGEIKSAARAGFPLTVEVQHRHRPDLRRLDDVLTDGRRRAAPPVPSTAILSREGAPSVRPSSPR